jgi:cytochrome oxidase assembly protein ShyY1
MAHRRRKKLDPVVERRRKLAIQWIGLAVLILVALYFVIRALQMP